MGNNATAKTRKTIGIIGAMEAEVASLKEDAKAMKEATYAGMDFCVGELYGKKVVIVQCGMGKVNAGICAHTLINLFGCDYVINTGVSGSLDPRLQIGDIVVSTDAVQHDFDVSPIGFALGEIPYTGLYAFPADERLRALAVEAVKEVSPDVGVYQGRVCSGDQFISTREQKQAIIAHFGGLCCEMEGAAVAQACYLSSVPFVVVRAVSDDPEGKGPADFGIFAAEVAKVSGAAIKAMVAKL